MNSVSLVVADNSETRTDTTCTGAATSVASDTGTAYGKRKAAAVDGQANRDPDVAKAMRKEKPMLPGQMSTPEEKTTRFTNALTGKSGGPGILREHTRSEKGKAGRPNKPYPHQRKCVKRMLPDDQKRMLMVHDPGTGKTFTFLLLVAAKHVIRCGARQKVMVSAPASCLKQWTNAVLDTLHINPNRILTTNRMASITADALENHDFIIVTRDVLGRAWSSCFEWVQAHHRNERGNWVSEWDRIAGTELHPIFKAKFSILGVDEAHFMRNWKTAWTKGTEAIARNSEKAIGLTATPVFNKPDDMIGICTAIDMPADYKSALKWYLDKNKARVNTENIREFNAKYVDRVADDILNLPEMTHETVDFDVCVDPAKVLDYNDILLRAKQLRVRMERKGKANVQEMHKLMAYLQSMQQFLVSPLLSSKGATEAKKDKEIIQQAAMEDTGALRALRGAIVDLNSRGIKRIMVAACHTSLLKVAEVFLKSRCPEVGDVIVYDGSLTQVQRSKAVDAFLGGAQTVLLMSIDAGGTGLHLAPGSNGVVFWGSRPFSPMQVLQTTKRVHRIGQEAPVHVVHLIANGSVDCAINKVHGDKLTLSRAVIDQDMGGLESEGGRWRTTGRIVDGCKYLSNDGVFPPNDITEEEVHMALSNSSLGQEVSQSSSVGPSSIGVLPDFNTRDPDLPPLPDSIVQALMANVNMMSTSALQVLALQM